MMRLAELHAAHTPQTHAYLFTWQSPAWNGRLGAGHTVEVPLVFGTLDAPDSRELVPAGSGTERFSQWIQDAWIAFARTGSPRTADIPDWEPYTASRRSTMLLDTTCRVEEAPHEPERQFWITHAPARLHRQTSAV